MKILRILAFAEGISLLVLLFIAMPLKYLLNQPEAVEVVGMLHGLLFIGYSLLLLYRGLNQGWKLRVMAISFLCAFIPGGTFYADRKYFKPMMLKVW